MSRRIALARLAAIFLLQFVVQSLSRSESTPSAILPCFLDLVANGNRRVILRRDSSALPRWQLSLH